jgi:hypothetical protein
VTPSNKGEAPNSDLVVHLSDCATHNAPALPVGPCDCGYTERAVVSACKIVIEKWRGYLDKAVSEQQDWIASRIIGWIKSEPRKSAVTAFTEGPLRQIAYAVEDAIRARGEEMAILKLELEDESRKHDEDNDYHIKEKALIRKERDAALVRSKAMEEALSEIVEVFCRPHKDGPVGKCVQMHGVARMALSGGRRSQP